MNRSNIYKLITSIVLAQAAGVVGSLFTATAISTWYATLIKPSFNPPSFVFGPVWITLYVLMGVALFLLWRKKSEIGAFQKRAQIVFNLFLVHLVVNALWSIVFFGMERLLLSVVVISILWIMIALLMLLSWRIDRRVVYLLLPYILWVSFAAVLNFSIWLLN